MYSLHIFFAELGAYSYPLIAGPIALHGLHWTSSTCKHF